MTGHIDHDVLERRFAIHPSIGLASTSQIPTSPAIGCMMDHSYKQYDQYLYYCLFMKIRNFVMAVFFASMFVV